MSLQDETFTLGVEEEFQIVNPDTYELSPDADQLVPEAQKLLGEGVQNEMMLSQVEVATPVCRTLDEVRAELTRMRSGLIDIAGRMGRQIAAAGTHPFSPWQEQLITPRERYQQLVRQQQRMVRQQVIFGCHVHVGLKDRELGIPLVNRTRLWLSPLLALAANSPFWASEDTQYSSYRTPLWWATPMSGPPPAFESKVDYDELVQALVATKSLEDVTRIYWDIRLPERFPTIEFRVMDVCMTLNEAVMAAGLVRALVRTCYEQALRNEPFPLAHTELLSAAHWRAARYGLDSDLIDVYTERLVPATQLIEQFLAFLRPALEAEGDWKHVSYQVNELLRRGNGAARQREVYRRTGQLKDVVEYIVAETIPHP
ncbi:MAG TPA: carboxylate-amine ligase [Ktedonobacteraceae bacterium]|nr:carboxylate-amine ligase [Ktedonobacteraceae bacterium]